MKNKLILKAFSRFQRPELFSYFIGLIVWYFLIASGSTPDAYKFAKISFVFGSVMMVGTLLWGNPHRSIRTIRLRDIHSELPETMYKFLEKRGLIHSWQHTSLRVSVACGIIGLSSLRIAVHADTSLVAFIFALIGIIAEVGVLFFVAYFIINVIRSLMLESREMDL